MLDYEWITHFFKAYTRELEFSIEERIDLNAACTDLDVLGDYLDTKFFRA